MNEPALYTGSIRHRRFHPVAHEFTYSLFMAFLDIDRIPETMRSTRVTSYNRFNWASFYERDHFGDSGQPLRARLRTEAAALGVAFPDGPVFLLTHLRYAGYCFNPISFYFCYSQDGTLSTVVAEVNSTFGESRNYWLGPHNARESGNSLRYACAKDLRVSPFMKMALDYEFVLTEPRERLVAHINTLDGGKPFFDATLTLRRQPWTPGTVVRALARQPFMTAQVMAAIHWQALRLWAKGVPAVPHPEVKS